MVKSWLPPWAGVLLTGAAVFFLAVLAQSTSLRFLDPVVPGPARLFTEIACLFPDAQEVGIDYRLEAYACDRQRFEEVDYRPYFPMRPDDKENRFQRLGHFYRHTKAVLEQLEDFVVARHNAAAAPTDGVAGRIGGIRLLSVRTPLPPPGGAIERFHQRPLAELTAEMRHPWFETPEARRARRCAP